MVDNIAWTDLAQVDAVLTAELLDNGNVQTHKIPSVGPTVCESNRKKLESLMRRDYLNFLENFDLQPGKKSFSKDAAHTSLGVFAKKKFIFNEILFGLTGFLAPMPSSEIIAGVNDVSIFDHSTGPKLMLGGVSFINSSCRENSVYVPNRCRSKVQIRVTAIKGIEVGEEVTVRYGGDFFGPYRMFCECPHAEFHGASSVILRNWTRSGKVKPIIHYPETPVKAISTLTPKSGVISPLSSAEKSESHNSKRKFKARSFASYVSRIKPKKSRYLSRKKRLLVSSSGSSSEELMISSEEAAIALQEDFANTDSPSPAPIEFSTPLLLRQVDNFVETSSSESSDSSTETPLTESEDALCDGSRVSMPDFVEQFIGIADQFALSERAVKSLLNLVERSLPSKNNLPSFYRLQQMEVNSNTLEEEELPNGVIFHLNVKSQLSALIERNIDLIYSKNWQLQEDIHLEHKENYQVLHFSLSTDGVSPAKSAKFSLYPVWLMLLNLPQKRRVCHRNLLLVSLFGGNSKPDCSSLMKNLIYFVHSFNHERVLLIGDKEFQVEINIRLVTVDAVMKAPLVNQTQFNGLYGCPNCLVPGQSHSSGKHWIYQYQESKSEMRTNKHRLEVLAKEPTEKKPIFGLRGVSAIESLVSVPEDVVRSLTICTKFCWVL